MAGLYVFDGLTVHPMPFENNILLDRVREKLQPLPEHDLSAPPADSIRDAAVLMAFTQGVDPKIVFIKRAEHLSSHQGQVAFPGGMWEPEDRHLLDTALRESEEEIALPREAVEVITVLKPRSTRFSVRVTPFVGIIPEGLEFIPEISELDAVFQAPLTHLLASENYGRSVFDTPAGHYEAPCIFYEHYRIWGFTFGVLTEVLKRVFDFSVPVATHYQIRETHHD
jgi:8-oxo-dGTP pyrophosphatase MutT (NUDIX family)